MRELLVTGGAGVKGGLKMSFYGEIKLYDYGGLILR